MNLGVQINDWYRDNVEFPIKYSHFKELKKCGETVNVDINGVMRVPQKKITPEIVASTIQSKWQGKIIGGWYAYQIVLFTKGFILIIDARDDDRLSYNIHSTTFEKCRQYEQDLINLFEGTLKVEDVYVRAPIEVEWFVKNPMGIHSYEFIEDFDDVILPEAYPYIEKLDVYIDTYITRDESVFVLCGPPGTGKTRLIRRILRILGDHEQERKRKAWELEYGSDEPDEVFQCHTAATVGYTTTEDVIKDSEIYLKLLSGNLHALVLEDIDFHLKSRKSGNLAMYQLLAASDGLICGLGGRKIIVSTNLEDSVHIDEALLRPGRCFNVLKTRLLERAEATALISALGKPQIRIPDKEDGQFSLAEIYRLVQ